MAKLKQPSQMDALRLGGDVATVKANMPPKRWKRFVKIAHKRGFTVGSALSDAPDALKERTKSSLQDEAKRTIATAYAPAQKELTQREAAVKYLDQKRSEDDAKYRQWLSGEVEKLDAQAAAADNLVNTQQQTIRDENEQAIKAARADSMQRVAATAGNISDPNQSTALDTSAADQRSRERIGNARGLTADMQKIGADARGVANASLLAQQAAREASRQADTWRAMGEVAGDREKLVLQQAADAAELVTGLIGENVKKAQSNREVDIARVELGQKADSLAATITEANRKYKLESKKFDLDTWKAKNKVIVDQAKIQLGYDQIENTRGKAQADSELKKWIERYRAKKTAERDAAKTKDKKVGEVSEDERTLYSDVQSALTLLKRWHQNKAVKPGEMRKQLMVEYGVPSLLIDVAEDLRRNKGKLSSAGRAAARKAGIVHSGYFWSPEPRKQLGSTTTG